MSSRRKIHTSLKFLVHTNSLPLTYNNSISKAQISKYKNDFNIENYFGGELNNIVKEQIDTLQLLNENKKLKQTIITLLKCISFLKTYFITTKQSLKLLVQPEIIYTIQKIECYFTRKTIAKCLKISTQKITLAIRKEIFACTASPFNICRKQHPTQLALSDIKNIETICENTAYKYWPLTSIYYQGVRNGLINFSINTFYKYCYILNIKRNKPIKNDRPKVGLLSYYPNQYWNADITIFKTKDNTKHYIYLVTDHFSKMIIAWSINKCNNATTRLNTFKDAIAFAKNKFTTPVQLVVDGGSENNNTTVDDYLYNIKGIIKKLVAQKDITHSNSAIEAINKILKNNYLNKIEIENGQQLLKIIETIIHDYNLLRPHGSLKGLTPSEVYSGLKTTDILPLANKIQSRLDRIKENKSTCCMDVK
jgi:hypothetical protein